MGTMVQKAEFRNMLVRNTQMNERFHTFSVSTVFLSSVILFSSNRQYRGVVQRCVVPSGVHHVLMNYPG